MDIANKLINLSPLVEKQNHHLWFHIENYYAQTYSQFAMKKHSHNRIEIMYITSGSCVIDALVDETWEKYILYSGEFVLIDSGIPHSLSINDKESTRVLNLEMSLLSPINQNNYNIQKLKGNVESVQRYLEYFNGVSKLIDDGYVQKIIIAIHRELQMNYSQKENDFIIDTYITQLIIEISRCASNKIRIKTSFTYVKKALSFIDRNFCHEIVIEDIAKEIDIHVIYLHRIFKQNIGMTIVQYINNLRIKRACIIIENSNRSINDIYLEVGFNNRQHFNHTFKTQIGVTPSDYKKKMMQDNFEHSNQDPTTNLVRQD